MTTVKLYYLNGDVLQLDSCATVGSIMTQVAMKHERFASDIAVVCLDTGKDLTDPPSQAPPPAVSVVLKQAGDPPTDEDLISTVLLHAEHGDIATCARALDMLRPLYFCRDSEILRRVLDDDTEGQQKILHTLVRAGVNGIDTLCAACDAGNNKTVEVLLAAGVPPDAEDSSGRTLLLTYACDNRRKDMMKILLSNGAQVDLRDRCGSTALMYASIVGEKDMVEILLLNGAQIDLADHEGETALINASSCGHMDVVKILLLNGSQVHHENHQGLTALRKAKYQYMMEILRAHGARH
eukprot:GEMP01039352.1.p1 GENE.GEMP01039352.1~~GEMP01039352.1.p1  ORF type:complete len:328 (+),score=62.07 GEMP01039352.1:97-984(+)